MFERRSDSTLFYEGNYSHPTTRLSDMTATDTFPIPTELITKARAKSSEKNGLFRLATKLFGGRASRV